MGHCDTPYEEKTTENKFSREKKKKPKKLKKLFIYLVVSPTSKTGGVSEQ